MRWTSKTPDLCQDSILASIRKLFEESEAELLPIQNQLKRYKKRNLQASHANRISRKVFGSKQTLFRYHHIENDSFDVLGSRNSVKSDLQQNTELTPPFDNTSVVYSSETSPACVTTETNNSSTITDWVEQRKKLRNGLNSMGMTISWLERKLSKTCLEESVLAQLQKENDQKTILPHILEESSKAKQRIIFLTIKKIAKVISKNEFLLNLFLSKSNVITRQDCLKALKQVQEVTRIEDEAIDIVLNFYFSKDCKNELFQKDLLHVLNQNKRTNPMITLSSLENKTENGSINSIDSNSTENFTKHEKEIEVKTVFKAMTEQQESRIQSYNKVREKFESENLPFRDVTFQKVLLHPDDVPQSKSRTVFIGQNNSDLLSEHFWKIRKRKRPRRRRRQENVSPESQETDDEKPKRNDLSQSAVFLPSLRDAAPEQHHINLSTGRALVGRKVDCWLSAEEYQQMTSGTNPLPLIRGCPDPNAFWPGHHLNKTRLCMTPCQSHPFLAYDKARDKSSIFQQIGIRPYKGKRTNPGYNNNELTWPMDGQYVKFGDIDMRKTYQL